MPFFTVIVPVFNTSQYLKCCVDSLRAQTFADHEILLVDDGSTDESPAICDEYACQDLRVHVIHKCNGGPPSARNAGLECARGAYVVFVDSDDFLRPRTLEVIRELLSDTSTDIVQFGTLRVAADDCLCEMDQRAPRVVSELTGRDSVELFLQGELVSSTVTDKAFRRDLIELYRFDDAARHFAEDVLFLGEVLYAARNLIVTDYVGYCYRRTPGPIVTMGLNRAKFESSMYVYSCNVERFRATDRRLFRLAESQLAASLLNWRIRRGEMPEGDVGYVSGCVQQILRRNIRSVLCNPCMSLRLRVLGLLTCVSFGPVDAYSGFLRALRR